MCIHPTLEYLNTLSKYESFEGRDRQYNNNRRDFNTPPPPLSAMNRQSKQNRETLDLNLALDKWT